MAKLRLLLDENIGILVAQRLRKEGYDIVSILEDMPGVQDTKVLAKAIRERRTLVTLDFVVGSESRVRIRES